MEISKGFLLGLAALFVVRNMVPDQAETGPQEPLDDTPGPRAVKMSFCHS